MVWQNSRTYGRRFYGAPCPSVVSAPRRSTAVAARAPSATAACTARIRIDAPLTTNSTYSSIGSPLVTAISPQSTTPRKDRQPNVLTARERFGRSLPCFSHGLGHGHRHRASPNQKSPLFPEIVAQSSTGAPRRCVRLCSSVLTSSRAGGGREILVHGLEAIVRSRCCSGSVQPVGQSLRRSVQLCDVQSSSSTR